MLVFFYLSLILLLMGFVYGPLGDWLPGLFPAQVRYTGAPWLKVSDRTLHGIAEDQTSTGSVQAGVVGTQDQNLRRKYQSPPGITDAPSSKTVVSVAAARRSEARIFFTITSDRPSARSLLSKARTSLVVSLDNFTEPMKGTMCRSTCWRY